MNYNKVILLISNDNKLSKELKDYLVKNKFNLIIAEDFQKAEKILVKTKIDVVLADLSVPEVNSFQLFLKVKKHSPEAKLIIVGTYDEDDIIEFANNNGVIKYFKKPLNLDKLKNLILDLFGYKGITGNIKDINLIDFLQLVMLSSNNKLISVTNPKITNLIGLVYIFEGKIIQAEYGGLEGIKALPKILSMKNGFFSELPWVPPSTNPINYSLKELKDNNIFINNQKSFEIHEGNFKSFISKENKSRSDIKILVVDDDKITLLILNEFLINAGYDVSVAESALEGSKLLKENFYDLVITDINMPEVNGFEFLLWINSNTPSTQVILISSFYSPENKSFSKQQGAIKYFKKPINLKELKDFIDNTVLNKGFTGSVNKVTIGDFLKMVELSGKTKLLAFSENENNSSGLIYFKDGKIIHAQYNNLIGDNAFYKIVNVKKAVFSDLPWIEPAKATIGKSFSELQSQNKNTYTKDISSEDKNKVEESNSLIRSSNKALERRKKQVEDLQKWDRNKKDLIIYESGVILGIIVGTSTKKDVIDLMKNTSKVNYTNKLHEQMFFFEDIDITFNFDLQERVDEVRFGSSFMGITSKGIRIGDELENAIKIYGPPKVSTAKGAIWDNIALYCKFGRGITSIRLKNSDFFQIESGQTINKADNIYPVSH